jgi:hypothetical protein
MSGEYELPDSFTVKQIVDQQKSVKIVFNTIKLIVKSENGFNHMKFTMTVTLDETISKMKKRIQQMAPDVPAEVMDLLKGNTLL